MNLGDLLQELRSNLLHDRSDQVAGASDYLWSDDTLVRYIDEAHRRFARRSWIIRDNTSSVTTITTVAGQQSYPLNAAVIAVLSLRMAGDNQDLPRAGHDALNDYHSPDPLFFNPATLGALSPGKALCWTTDESVLTDPNGSFTAINLQLYPAISAPYGGIAGKLRVIRLPVVRFSVEDLTAYPEVPEDHHLDMLDWAAYLALRSPDTDIAGGGAPQRAADLANRFEAHCQDARKGVMRKIFSPVQWGFGHNGWSWGS